jgi:YD repeat-containing protein
LPTACRELSRTDTYGINTSTGYDLEGNAISQTDGKGQTTQFQYDAANRRTKAIDRLAGNTVYGYDLAGNETSIVDAEGQTTLYTYNSRGHRATETFPDHVGGSNPGDAGYGIVAYEFDPMGRSQRRTDQLGDTVTTIYDMVSRILQRDFRTRANSPSGTISDSDVMTHDRMGRMLTGASGRYSNTIAFSFDDIGRPANESLTISGQTYTTSYTHDAMNRRSGMTLPDGSVVLRTFTNRSQLHQAKLDGFTLDTRAYDAGGRHSTSTYGNGVGITHAYRVNGSLKDDLLASITTTHPGGIPSGQQVGNYSYTWDANRNKLSESITGVLSGMGFAPVTYL